MTQPSPKPHPTRQRFGALDAAKKNQLLDPAEAEFARHGYTAASLNQILLNAGMSKGQAYYYIRNKPDLYCLVCERAFERLTTTIGGWTINFETTELFWTSINQLFSVMATALMNDPRLADIGRTAYASNEAYDALREPLSRLQTFIKQVTQKGQTIGAIRSDMPVDLLSSLLFAHLSALDRWFAQNMTTLPADEMIRLSTLNQHLFRDIASPKAPLQSKRSEKP